MWQPVGEIPGGTVTALANDSAGVIYAGVLFQGVYRSTDNGLTWHLSLPVNSYISAFAIDRNGNMLVTNDYGLYRSTDQGVHWALVRGFFHPFAVTTNSLGYIFVGSEQDFGVGDFYRSTDDGASWTRHLIPDYATAYSLLATPDDALFAGTGYGIFRSTNHAATWDSINTGLTHRSMTSIARSSSSIIFAGTFRGGVFRSTNHGNSWTQSGLPGEDVFNVSVGPNDFVYAATGHGVSRSTDAGATWVQTNVGLTNTNTGSVAAFEGDVVFTGTEGSGVFKSTNNGDGWLHSSAGIVNPIINCLIVDNNDRIWAGPAYGGGIACSTNKGLVWENVGLDGISVRLIRSTPTGAILAATYDGIWRSTNTGVSWTHVPVWLDPYADLERVVTNSLGYVFVSADSAVYRSTDDGLTWTPASSGLPDDYLSDLAITPDDHLFVVIHADEIFRSTDNGNSWHVTSNGMADEYLETVGVNVNGDIYVAGDSVFRSTDDGASWAVANSGLPRVPRIGVFAFNQKGHAFVGAYGGVMHRSVNSGFSWENISSGMPNDNVSAMVVDSSGFVYVSTGSGIFRTIESTTSVSDRDAMAPTQIDLFQNYPNPFNPTTHLEFWISEIGFVQLRVFDLLGREVATLVNEKLNPGTHTATFDGSGRGSGLYVYRLEVNGHTVSRKMLLLK
jgi:photosystem II stability/assembly factor-like uncharacterized protein